MQQLTYTFLISITIGQCTCHILEEAIFRVLGFQSNLLSDIELSQCTRTHIHLGSVTFGNTIIQKVSQNQPSSPIISILGCFVQLCHLIAKCQSWTFKMNFLYQKSSIFGNVNFKIFFLQKSGPIFDKAAKLEKECWSGRMANFVNPFEKKNCQRCPSRG